MSVSSSKRVESLDFVRGLAMIHIVLYHYYIEWFHGSFLVTPDRVGQNLQLFQDGGVIGFLKNAVSFLFFYGFTSVNMFLLLSGFVLTLSSLSRKSEGVRRWIESLWKRIKRLLIPFYISVILGIGILYLRNFLYPSIAFPPVYGWIDMVKLLFFPLYVFDFQILQLFNGDYWYIALILQFSLLFPVLFWFLKKIGPKYFLFLSFVITVLYRSLAVYGFTFGIPWFDSVPMGVLSQSLHGYYGFSFFIPRLFEFAVGMVLAHYYFSSEKFLAKLVTYKFFVTSTFVMLFGFFLLYFRAGWIFSDGIIAIGLFVFFLNIGERISRIQFLSKIFKKIGDSAYETYLLHHYLLNYFLLPFLLVMTWQNETFFWICMPLYLFMVFLAGYASFRLTVFIDSSQFTIKSLFLRRVLKRS